VVRYIEDIGDDLESAGLTGRDTKQEVLHAIVGVKVPLILQLQQRMSNVEHPITIWGTNPKGLIEN
jgi:hypothetical protein